jgi:hypothetical protein
MLERSSDARKTPKGRREDEKSPGAIHRAFTQGTGDDTFGVMPKKGEEKI